MASTKSVEILELIKKVTQDPTYDYMQDYNNLGIDNDKRSIVFRLRIKNRRFQMNEMDCCFKKFEFFVAVKSKKLYEFIEFVRLNKIVYIEIFTSKVICYRKWFNHWDLKSVRFYPYCKINRPVLTYYCYPEYNDFVKKNSIE